MPGPEGHPSPTGLPAPGLDGDYEPTRKARLPWHDPCLSAPQGRASTASHRTPRQAFLEDVVQVDDSAAPEGYDGESDGQETEWAHEPHTTLVNEVAV